MKQQYVKLLVAFCCSLLAVVAMAQSGVQLSGGVYAQDNATDIPYLLKSEKDIPSAIDKNLFIKVIVSKEKCFVGEPILVTYKLYTRLQSESKLLKQPDFNGCSVIEMTSTDIEAAKEVIDGKVFRSYVIRRVQLVPLQEGDITLGTATIDNTISFYKNAAEIAQHKPSITQTATITSTVKLIHISNLPTFKGASHFSNSVGTFMITAKALKTLDTANDNNSLEIRIDGIGNFQNIMCPVINWPKKIDHFEVVSTESLDKFSFPISGKKVFTVPFICKQAGNLVIPPISFTYFDADKQVYTTTSTDSIHIKVLPVAEKIEMTKISTEVGNGKYIWIVLGIALVAGFVLWLSLFRKKIPTTIATTTETIAVLDKTDTELLNDLLLLEDDKLFFQESKSLATNFLQKYMDSNQQKQLYHIINQCNEVLYAYNNGISKAQIFEELEQVITS
ncbi:BatD family protein [Parasediminibacterium paludis]|uniref:BatD family protein n=1 Tax=Parasediminibacterium paludis TaxID=908966 RepID=A0ABV8PT58_9BACT